MELKARTKAKVGDIVLKLTEKKGNQNWAVRFGINSTRKQFEKMAGEDFSNIVFGAFMNGGEGDGTWALKKPQPSADMQCETHRIVIDGQSISTKPKVVAFAPIKDTEKVQTVVDVKLGKAQVALLTKLIKKQGNECEFEIEPSLHDLPMGQTTANLSEKPKVIKGGRAN